jgi:hypothetical protein
MKVGQLKKVLNTVRGWEQETEGETEPEQKILLLKGAWTLGASQARESIVYLKSMSNKQPDLIGHLCLKKPLEKFFSHWVAEGTDVRVTAIPASYMPVTEGRTISLPS